MSTRRRALGAAALLAAIVVMSSACKGGADDGGATGSTADKPAAENRIDINPVPREALPDGGSLRWPLVAFPPNFNTWELDGTAADTANVVGPLLPAMFGFDSEARPAVNRHYLDSADLTAQSPRQVVTYRINPRAVWDDGRPIAESDFRAQWKALSEPTRRTGLLHRAATSRSRASPGAPTTVRSW